ncbi:prolyl oligopeptidase family serine peptidase [Candidatus Bathyarchaeota archaeon]|jgi:acetyl esterase/lipase|nr:prolyl oligopeptidase family serine peptidase [Candidatus Bathyarchaeota archaeon]MBT4320367.1 prolyl oligopeptidase family serine peptidase [Candidatus Bathyarchaeota archaeon]MBT4424394.1 prolyl oligopeptidase family serine peptidase [Candidatus Bathyarchaeota archaeon]MBT5642067.1 prolyl oligopeptidase family serine peptidase [Candidatus Bathyarchaeota archaeon]MBT6605555.1 prolyl oligopeptidase family serine peptidase [Candidatus Bathyarchaeota archaeon]
MKLEKGEQKRYFKAGGEWCYIWTPPGFEPGKTAPVLIHHHGAGGYVREGESDWVDTPSKAAYLRAAMDDSGCVVAGTHACGNHWGNPCSVEANTALLKHLEGVEGIDTGRLGFMGGGLGGAVIWNSVLGPFAGKVKAVAVMQAVANLSTIVVEQKFKGVMLEAYGIPQDSPDDEAIKRIVKYDPMPGLQALEKGTSLPKTIIYHGAKDVNIPPDTSAKMLAAALENAGGDVTLELFDEVEHNTYAMGKPMEDKLRIFFSVL